jgi:hypothetical protein
MENVSNFSEIKTRRSKSDNKKFHVPKSLIETRKSVFKTFTIQLGDKNLTKIWQEREIK